MALSDSRILPYLSTFLGTVTFGFGVHYVLAPRSAFSNFGFAAPTFELPLIDAIMVLYGFKDLYMGISIWAATWAGNRKVAGINVLALGLCALGDGYVVKSVAGSGEWNHWGYGSVAVGVGSVMLGLLG
ncbi:putative integral membrane protein [Byssothecium circinans]|uniref:Putative integral membrane protein n=1 Tax=Byssothecium circinans TaxID=147558 RepID=A0A6A5U983_9PLEO|nr:putative integral membrane protein [Byssothecium circinans]